MLHAKPVWPSQANLRSVKRKQCSGRDASYENRIYTVKRKIRMLSTSRRVHNFNDFRAGYFRNAALCSKVDANQTPAQLKTSIRMIGRVGMESMTKRVIIMQLMTGSWSRNDLHRRYLLFRTIKGNLLIYKYIVALLK